MGISYNLIIERNETLKENLMSNETVTHTEDGKQLYFVNKLDGTSFSDTPVTKEHFSSREGFSIIGDSLHFIGLQMAMFVAVTE